MAEQEYVTGNEFGRWRADFAAYQTREAAHLELMERRILEHIDARVDGIDGRLDVLNGRTRTNSEAIVKLDGQVEAIAAHRQTLAALAAAPMAELIEVTRPRWHRDKRVMVGAGIGTTAMTVLWALTRLFEALTAHAAQVGTIVK